MQIENEAIDSRVDQNKPGICKLDNEKAYDHVLGFLLNILRKRDLEKSGLDGYILGFLHLNSKVFYPH